MKCWPNIRSQRHVSMTIIIITMTVFPIIILLTARFILHHNIYDQQPHLSSKHRRESGLVQDYVLVAVQSEAFCRIWRKRRFFSIPLIWLSRSALKIVSSGRFNLSQNKFELRLANLFLFYMHRNTQQRTQLILESRQLLNIQCISGPLFVHTVYNKRRQACSISREI